jgi:topoisomerase-4 subunit A
VECTKFDKIILVFKDGHYQVSELQEKLFVGPDLFYCGLPERDRVFTCAYTDRKATYLKRFKFGGTILNKLYHCIPAKSRILFFEPDTPAELYIKYKPAPYQKITQQTCKPSDVEVKGPKTRGRQISTKDVGSINSTPSRGWDPKAATTKLEFG